MSAWFEALPPLLAALGVLLGPWSDRDRAPSHGPARPCGDRVCRQRDRDRCRRSCLRFRRCVVSALAAACPRGSAARGVMVGSGRGGGRLRCVGRPSRRVGSSSCGPRAHWSSASSRSRGSHPLTESARRTTTSSTCPRSPSILESGDASSLTLRTLIETDRTFAFYPSAWHSLVVMVVQLTGACGPGRCECHVDRGMRCGVAPRRGVARAGLSCGAYPSGVVALVALPLGAAFGTMPYALLSWGTLYPTFLATALVPAAVAIPVVAWNRLRARAGRFACGSRSSRLAGLALTLGAVVFAQPRVLVTWLVLIAPGVIAVLVGAFLRARRAGGAVRRTANRWLITGLIGSGRGRRAGLRVRRRRGSGCSSARWTTVSAAPGAGDAAASAAAPLAGALAIRAHRRRRYPDVAVGACSPPPS